MKRNLLGLILYGICIIASPVRADRLLQGTIPTTDVYLPLVANSMATPLPTLTATPIPTNTPIPPAGEVVIDTIFYDGLVPRVESDEYVEILNQRLNPVQIGGWRLNAGDSRQNFMFPSFTLGPNQRVRVYTNEIHMETGGFSFGINHAIWNNQGDCGDLYDSAGTNVSHYCYP